ncbi:MAG: discoidin domain-containing protein [Acidobacteriota bacterium]
MKALAALAGAAFTVAACYALGAVIVARLGARLRRDEKFPLAFVVGAAVLHLAIFAVMALGFAYKPVLIGMLTACVGAACATGDWRLPVRQQSSREDLLYRAIRYLFGIIAAAFTVLYLFNAWAPEISPDGSSYHLGLVARYLRARGFERVTTNMLFSFSEGVEMLYVPAFAIGRHSAAALVHFAFLLSLALAVLAYGKRIGKPLAGAAAALLVYLSPIVGIDGTSAYTDVAAAAIVFAVFYWIQLWDENRNNRILIAAGLLAGYCYAAKYTAFVMIVYAVGLVAWRTRKWQPVGLLVGCSLIMAAPWAVKDWIYLHNPVAPFANQWFPNPYLYVLVEKLWTARMRTYGLKNLWTLPLEVTIHGETTQGLLGPVFLAAPLALLALRSRAGRILLIPGALVFITYVGNIGTRFLIPSLPFLSLAMALALEGVAPLLALLVVFHAVSSWPTVLMRYTNAWSLHEIPYKAALRILPEEQFLGAHTEYQWARMVEKNVPPGKLVFTLSGLPDAYTTREVLITYWGGLNNDIGDALTMGWSKPWQPVKLLSFILPDAKYRRLRVVQTGVATFPEEQWNVHEIRLFHGGAELPRRPAWRLQAFPDPWGVQRAFDNSEATRWRSWETLRPGMWIAVDLGREEDVDRVQVELSGDEWDARMRLETTDAGNRWIPLTVATEERHVPPSGSLRRAATYEAHLRGVDYFLIKDDDYGAGDYAEFTRDWGLTLLEHAYGASVYRVNPDAMNPAQVIP